MWMTVPLIAAVLCTLAGKFLESQLGPLDEEDKFVLFIIWCIVTFFSLITSVIWWLATPKVVC